MYRETAGLTIIGYCALVRPHPFRLKKLTIPRLSKITKIPRNFFLFTNSRFIILLDNYSSPSMLTLADPSLVNGIPPLLGQSENAFT